jgi:hypothetical protein
MRDQAHLVQAPEAHHVAVRPPPLEDGPQDVSGEVGHAADDRQVLGVRRQRRLRAPGIVARHRGRSCSRFRPGELRQLLGEADEREHEFRGGTRRYEPQLPHDVHQVDVEAHFGDPPVVGKPHELHLRGHEPLAGGRKPEAAARVRPAHGEAQRGPVSLDKDVVDLHVEVGIGLVKERDQLDPFAAVGGLGACGEYRTTSSV